MPNLSKDKLKEWGEKLRVGKVKTEQVFKELDLYRRYYVGDQDILGEGDGWHKTILNMVFANISTILPSIIFRNPRIYVTAKRKPSQQLDTVAGASILEIILNYFFEELNLKREIERSVFDALQGHSGIIQVGYTLKTEKIADGENLIVNELIKSESPFGVRVPPKNLNVDPEGTDHLLNDCEWISFKKIRKLDDLKRDPNFKNIKNLKTNTSSTVKDFDKGHDTFGENDHFIKGLWKRIEYEEIWDKRTKRIISLVMNGMQTTEIRNDPWPQDLEGFPIEIIYFNENPDNQTPLADISIYKRQQDELNKMKSLQVTQIENISGQKYASQDGTFTNRTEQHKLLTGPPGTIIRTQGDPAKAIFPLTTKAVSQDILTIINQLKNDISFLASTADFERGGPLRGVNTATEATLVNQGISIQRDARQGIVENFTVRIMKKLAQILQQTLAKRDFVLTDEQFQQAQAKIPQKIEKIVGIDGGEKLLPWIMASKKDIQGEYNFKIEVGSMVPVNKQTRKQNALELMQILVQNPFIDPIEALKRIFEVFEVRDFEKLLLDPQKVMQQQRQAAEAESQAQAAEVEGKRKTDIIKTQMKSRTALDIQNKKSQTTLLAELIKGDKGSGK